MTEKLSILIWLLIFSIAPIALNSGYHIQLVTQLLIFTILFIGVDIAVGHAGLISIAHGALFGIGAYATAVLSVDHNWPFSSTLPIGILLAAILGLIIGILTLKLDGHYFVIATMAFSLLTSIVIKNTQMTHGELGISNIPKPDILSLFSGDATLAFYYLTLISAVMIIAVYLFLMNSAFGRRLRSIRDNTLLADALGVDISMAKLLAFVLSAGIAAFAGSLYASFLSFINPQVASYEIGFTALMALIIGGRTTVGGAIIGAAIFTILPELLREAEQYRLIVLGALLILIVQRAPNGLYGKLTESFHLLHGRQT